MGRAVCLGVRADLSLSAYRFQGWVWGSMLCRVFSPFGRMWQEQHGVKGLWFLERGLPSVPP